MSNVSRHIIATEVPPGFLKRSHVRAHFSRFGTITRLTIQKTYCMVSFENEGQAQDAVFQGKEWRSMPLKVDFTPNHDPFGAEEAFINEELNWFAEEPYTESQRPIIPKVKETRTHRPEEPRSRLEEHRTLEDFPPPKLHRHGSPKDVQRYSKPVEENKSSIKSPLRREKVNEPVPVLMEEPDKPKKRSDLSIETLIFSRVLKEEKGDRKLKRKSSHDRKAKSKKIEEEVNADYSGGMVPSPSRVEDSESAFEEKRSSSPTVVEYKLEDVGTKTYKTEEIKASKILESSLLSRVAVTLKDRFDILEERDKLIRSSIQKKGLGSVIQGTCPDMCPEKERILRELRRLVEPYEALADGRMDQEKAIKEYTRSSADQGIPLPHELRPEPVLTMTMAYLINCIISRIDEMDEENLSNWYNFCWGRLRAIRKDIIQQDLRDKNTVGILEQCARFHIACYDRLRGLGKFHFDDKLNTEALNGYLTMLINMYKDLGMEGASCPNEDEFNSYLILLNMNNSGFLASKYEEFSKSMKESQLIKEAAKITMAYHNNMFSTYFKLVKNTSYLNACLAQRFFQHVRVEALNTIVKSHSIPNNVSNIYVDYMMTMLKLDSEDECVAFCESAGLEFSRRDKCFKVYRNDFSSEYIYQIESPSSLMSKKRITMAEAVVGHKDIPVYLKHEVHDSFDRNGALKENAMDASDQEEKMLRDDIERKLLVLRKLEADSPSPRRSSSVESLVGSVTQPEADAIDSAPVSSLQSSFHKAFSEESNEAIDKPKINVSPKPSSPEKNVTSPFNFTKNSSTLFDSKPEEENIKKSGKPSSPKENLVAPSHSFTESVFPPKPFEEITFSSSFNKSAFTTPVTKKVFSPKPVTQPEPLKETQKGKEPPNPILLLQTKSSEKDSQVFDKKLNLKAKLQEPKPSSPQKPSKLILKKAKTKESSFKLEKQHNLEKLQQGKLKKKLGETMKKVSARKYLKVWKEKVKRIKLIKEFEAMILLNMDPEHYIKVWGKAPLKRSVDLPNHLSRIKKDNIMVQLVLNSDILNQFDRGVHKIKYNVVEKLGGISVKKAHEWGNIAQPYPVYWKLVFALPAPPKEGTTFTMKLRDWCKAAFYRRADSQLGQGEIYLSSFQVPVVLKVEIVEGTDDLSRCNNLSALVVVRAHLWETRDETEERLRKLLGRANVPVPAAVVSLDEKASLHLSVSHEMLSQLFQAHWSSLDSICTVLNKLASNTFLLSLKVKPFNEVIGSSVEKLFDIIHTDAYIDDVLRCALRDPNNVISFYNQLIKKIEEEVIHCVKNNYFGTAHELKADIEKFSSHFIFPENYHEPDYINSLASRFQMCQLRLMKLDFQDWEELKNYLTNYYDDFGCKEALKQVLRALYKELKTNITTKRSINIKAYDINWLELIEMTAKEKLTSTYLSFHVVFRQTSLKDILLSQFFLQH